jgi:hypothetical protein
MPLRCSSGLYVVSPCRVVVRVCEGQTRLYKAGGGEEGVAPVKVAMPMHTPQTATDQKLICSPCHLDAYECSMAITSRGDRNAPTPNAPLSRFSAMVGLGLHPASAPSVSSMMRDEGVGDSLMDAGRDSLGAAELKNTMD